MPAYSFICGSCGYEFSAVVTEEQLEGHVIPCPGCGEHDLTVTGKSKETAIYSREAEDALYRQCQCLAREKK